MRVTQRQIADIVGVSSVAVSHALHQPNSVRISAEKQREIMRVAHELGYEPRNLTTHAIGFVIDSDLLQLDVTENAIVLVHEILKAYGYRMLFVMVDEEKTTSLNDTLNLKTVDGVLFNCWCGGRIEKILPRGIPWLLLADEEHVGDGVDQVTTDIVQAALSTARHLIAQGHQRLGLVAGSPDVGYCARLQRGVGLALESAGLPADNMSMIQLAPNGATSPSLLNLMSRVNRPTAIVAASAGKAMVVLNRLMEAGYWVPRDVSLVAMGDSYRLKPLIPAISANAVFDREVIERGIERLIQKIKFPATPTERVLLAGRYIERDSVAAPSA